MSLSVNGVSNLLPGVSGANISEAAAMMQAEMARTDYHLDAIRAAQTRECPVELMEACKAFESFFLQMLFKEMRATVPDSRGVFERSSAERIFTDMLDEQVAITAANGGGIGLAAFMFQQMQREGLTLSAEEIRARNAAAAEEPAEAYDE